MKKTTRAFLLAICLLSSTPAQNTISGRTPTQNSADTFDRFTRELILQQLEADRARAAGEVAQPREAQFRERQFVDKVNKFVRTWSRFALLYNERKAFDIKTAKELSKESHELETSGDWPALDRK